MAKEKHYTVHRCGWKEGGTQHWFSHPLLEEDAKELAKKWENPNYIPTNEECTLAKRIRLDSLEYVILKEYREPTDFADGKMRSVTIGGKNYFYQTISQEDCQKITTIFDSGKNAIYKYNGDPHDYQPSSVKRIIKEGRL